MKNEASKIIYTTVSIDKETGRLIEKICKRYSLKKSEVVKLAFLYLEKAHINPADAPESVKSELAKINKRQDDIIRFIRHYEEEQLNPMIRTSHSITVKFDTAIGILTEKVNSEINTSKDFIGIPYEEFGDNILKSGETASNKYLGHILPEEKSHFKGGYKIVSFYIDANSLMRRAFVLRQEGWRKKDNIGYYQRMFEPKKISDMRKYLSEKERVFINNIITTISEDKIKLFDDKDNELKIDENGQFINSSKTRVTPTKIEITDECNIIGLIDGQHRTFAYHEGDDIYEDKIKNIRDVQNLLVTGIIFPKKEKKETRLKFEANLFLEINNTQTKVKSQLTQEIELMINPFSSISIGKKILMKLNENGPLENLIEQYSFEKGKLKTASIVSFGLNPLIKLDEKSTDRLFYIWDNPNKLRLKDKETEEYELLEGYTKFAIEKIRDIFIAIKNNLDNEQWHLYSHETQKGVLNVTFFNGILNLLRFLIENNQVSNHMEYSKKLKGKEFNKFSFKDYKSSQYRKMGYDIYNNYFK